MGLDAVEIVMRVEEFYSISCTDDEAAQVRTVGDFYKLICSKLDLDPLSDPATSASLPKVADYETSFLIFRRRTPLPPPGNVRPWTPQSIWDTLVALLADQQGLNPADIYYSARFVEDLGVD